ncbi:UDP-3-O-(3-hydroxymyristoyl)glucosamine N-acyltransferase, partial [candidate division GN15 bacterium]|nr:UDP-3-O-(3-hydroxymyristoyl)glucosamine N-acyltransferase [candidate division GN15 bacterium]
MSSRSYTLAELAERVGGTVDGDGSVEISGVNTITDATSGQLSFVHNKKYVKFIPETRASALVLPLEQDRHDRPALRHDNPYLTFARLIDILYPLERIVPPGVHPSAHVDEAAELADSVGIGPLCTVDAGVRIGANTQVTSAVSISRGVTIGENCLIHPGVRILHDCRIGNNVILHPGAVIGSDGFGFAESEAGARKIQHIG